MDIDDYFKERIESLTHSNVALFEHISYITNQLQYHQQLLASLEDHILDLERKQNEC